MRGGLSLCGVPSDPFMLFDGWLREAVEARIAEPTAMVVATVSPEGRPSTRTVLLKKYGEGEFVFFTNYESRKGMQLAANPNISLSFVWYPLERQVHIEGTAAKMLPELSDGYFNTRPYDSRVAAIVSPQSRPIGSRMELLRAFVRAQRYYLDHEVGRPDGWGGYVVSPERIEFWQGRENRLHDRILYTLRPGGKWESVRLAP